jgi:hypothetical protein
MIAVTPNPPGPRTGEQNLAAAFLNSLREDIESGRGEAFSSACSVILDPHDNFDLFCWALDLDPDVFRERVLEMLLKRADFPIQRTDPAYEGWLLAAFIHARDELRQHRCTERVGDMCKWKKQSRIFQGRLTRTLKREAKLQAQLKGQEETPT